MSEVPKISLPAEPIFDIYGFTLTNSHLAAIFVSLILIFMTFRIGRNAKLIPSRWQIMLEIILTFFLSQLKNAYGTDKRAKRHLPYILTMFLFILISNQFGIFPLLANIITEDGAPLFRTPTSHYALPITMAVITIVSCNLIAFSVSPLRYIGKFIKIKPFLQVRSFGDFGMAFIEFFLGLLDIVSEAAKMISMSSRLFGNVLAGEVMVVVIASISIYTQFIVPLPFMFLSLASGVIQAFVFTFLALNFMAMTIPTPEERKR